MFRSTTRKVAAITSRVSLLGLLLLVGCVTPPPEIKPSVLNEQDLDIVTYLTRGGRYATSGRPELAEEEFRKAIKLSPSLSNAYNNLGYSLQMQNRFEEAVKYYEYSLGLDASNVSARINLAYSLYRLGLNEQALEQYYELIFPEKISLISDRQYYFYSLSEQQLFTIYRNIAVVSYSSGDLEQALCYSSLAVQRSSNDINQVGQHSRMLMSLDRNREAVRFLRDSLEKTKVAVPPGIFVDYGISLLVVGDGGLARQAAQRALSDQTAEVTDRIGAFAVQVLASKKDLNNPDNELAKKGLLENSTILCDTQKSELPEHWPFVFLTNVRKLISEVCADEAGSDA